MKKIFSCFLVFLLAFTVVSCKKKNDTPTTPIDVTLREVKTTKLVNFKGPSILTSSNQANVTVNGEEVFVYETRVNHGRVFTFSEKNITKVPVAIFDFEGKVEVEVSFPNETTLENVKVTPQIYDVETIVIGNKVKFTLEYPTTYTIEYNNQTEKVLHLITHEPEENVPDPNNLPENMLYIGPGVYKADAIPVSSNKTIYLAGGALIYGQIRGGSVENVTICGRGIISGEIYPRTVASEFTIPFEFQRSKNIKVEGITFLDSAGWTINAYFLDGFTMDNIAIITGRGNGDGISIQSCKNVTVKNSFVRSWDDSLVVKNYNMGTTENILFENITIWTDLAQSMEVGYECYGATINNVHFNNITILHNFHKAAISIHNADQALVTNINFTNITIEDAQMEGDNSRETYDNFFIDFQVLYNIEWTSSGQTRGRIRNVLVENVLVLNSISEINSKVSGFDNTNNIENVTLRNITYCNKKIEKAADLNLTTKYAKNVKIEYNTKNPQGAKLIKPYNLALTDDKVDIETINNIVQFGYLVPDFAINDVPSAYMGVLLNGDFTTKATRGTKANVWDDESGIFDDEDLSAIVDKNADTAYTAPNWDDSLSNDFIAITIDLNSTKTIGTIRLYGNPDSKIYLTQSIAVYAVKESSTTGAFAKISNQDNYEFTPATGNFVDIVINPGSFTKIQIRIYHKTGGSYPESAFLNEIEFYPASLTFNKTIYGTKHEDVYIINNLIDGSRNTYYESSKALGFTTPPEITIDLQNNYDIKYINMYLVPLLTWEARTEEITISVSLDGNNYTDIIVKKACLFDPTTGSVIEIILDEPVEARYIKFTVYSNTAPGSEGAQLSEIAVYE